MHTNITCSYESCTRDAWQPVEDETLHREPDEVETPYCIFHSPKIEKKQVEFQQAWEDFLEQCGDHDGSYRILFCTGFIFPIDVSFRKVTFSEDISFKETIFSKKVDFSGKKFSKYADFTGAKFLQKVNFRRAEFSEIADFMEAEFQQKSFFSQAVFTSDAFFKGTKFSGKTIFWNTCFKIRGNFTNAGFTGADLSNASLTNCSFENVTYNIKPIKWEKPEKWWHFWNYHKLEKPIPPTNFTGIETAGILAASNRQFVRDIRDQQFLNQFKVYHPCKYKIWLYSCDCGRSFLRLFFVCLSVAIFFGFLYFFKGEKWFDNAGEWNWITAFYYSIVTFSTLGFGDIAPKLSSSAGQLTVMLEVFLGYLGLVGLISIFANKLARRA